MKRSLLVPSAVLIFIALLAIGCTSSSTPTAQTNPGYSSQFSQPTRGTSGYGNPTQQPQTAPLPKATLMLFSFETGDIETGKGYNIYAVADNPNSMALRYKWEVTGGALNLVADSDKDSLNSEIKTALAPPPPAAPEAGTGAGATPATGTGTTTPATSAPSGVSATPPTGATTATPSGTGVSAPPPIDPKEAIFQQWLKDHPGSTPDQIRQYRQTLFGGPGSPQGTGAPPQTSQAPPSSTSARYSQRDLLHSSLVVLGLLDEPKPDDTKPAADAQTSSGDKDQETKPAADAQTETKPAEAAPAAPPIHAPAIREGGPTSRANRLGDLGVSSKTTIQSLSRSEATAKKFSAQTSKQEIVTDDPFVNWTPDKSGKSTIKCTILSEKAKPLTDSRALDVVVSDPVPVMTVEWEKADKIKAEDYVYVDVKVANLPDFTKALFNVNYDKDKFLFKYAKLGDFFPAKDNIDFFYAQPNKDVANITGAISYNVLSRPLKGNGIVAQLVFKAKDNIADVSSVKFSQNEDAAFKYVLDDTGTNILPAVQNKTIPATERVNPQTPAAPTTTPTAGLPSTPQPPTGNMPVTQPGGGTLTPPLPGGQQTYTPAPGGGTQNQGTGNNPAPIQSSH